MHMHIRYIPLSKYDAVLQLEVYDHICKPFDSIWHEGLLPLNSYGFVISLNDLLLLMSSYFSNQKCGFKLDLGSLFLY